MKYTINQCIMMILWSLFLQAGEHRGIENVSSMQQKNQSSWGSKFCFGCHAENKVEPDISTMHSQGSDTSIDSQTIISQVTTIKPSQIHSYSLELSEISTISDNSTPSNFAARKKPTEKKSFLQSFKQIFTTQENINAPNRRGVVPLHAAIAQGDVTEVIRCIDAGANVNLCNNDGDSPLHLAMRNSSRDRQGHEYTYIAQCLLEHGAVCDHANKLGRTPLHCAVENLSADSVALLIFYKADMNVQDKHGYTPLMLLVRQNMPAITSKPTELHQLQADIVKLLLQAGADPKILCFDDDQSVYGYANYQIKFHNNMLPVIADYIHYAQYPKNQIRSTRKIDIVNSKK